jgi:CubicO group peptidase (beta-lactamase class C family)
MSAALLATQTVKSAQQTGDIQQTLDGTLRPDIEVATLEHSELLYPVELVPRGATVRSLPKADTVLGKVHFDSNGKNYDIFDYLAENRVAGLLVLKNGRVAMEDYELGAGPQTRWASFSLAKSVTSALIGIALRQGYIGSLDDPVTRYVPLLRGGPYKAVSIRNVLMMASGVRWNETYTDPASDCRRLLDAQLTRKPGASIGYMNTLSRTTAPGMIWNYNSGETNIAGAVVEGATHMTLAKYLSKTLWSKLGMEQDATWWVEAPGGIGLGGAGLSATLRDYARFGLFVEQGGAIYGRSLVPQGWFQEAGRSHVIGGKSVDYGYLWWPFPAGDAANAGAFQAIGIFGQHIYITSLQHVVIVVLSARSKPTGQNVIDDSAFFGAVVRALR